MALCLSALFLGGITSFSAFAADGEPEAPLYKISVKSDPAAADIQDTVEVSVVLSSGAKVGAIVLDLSYDTDCFEYVEGSAKPGEIGYGPGHGEEEDIGEKPQVPENTAIADIGIQEGKLTLSLAKACGSLGNPEKPTVLMTASFNVLKADGALNAEAVCVYDDSSEGVDITGKGEVKDWVLHTYFPGDVNGDDAVTAADMQRIYVHMNGRNKFSDEDLGKADVNGDNAVTAGDMQRIYAHMNGSNPLF